MIRWRLGFVVGFVCLAVAAASGQIRKADLVTLVGDTDDAIRLMPQSTFDGSVVRWFGCSSRIKRVRQFLRLNNSRDARDSTD